MISATFFSKLLKGRAIRGTFVNELGMLSILTEELGTGRLIEIDNLSSGEKNIALTFLLVARTIAKGGIALFDEPELHLNPLVCRELLPFMLSQYSEKRDIQFIMCTHSPEILSGAFKEINCTLLHLKTSSDITRVGKGAFDEYSNALQRLGAGVGETLFYDGTIFVEGESDVAFLEKGFPELTRRYQIKDRGGRKEIEKSVKELQSLEERGERVSPVYLIFDRDNRPTEVKSSKAVGVLQWPRYCIENYLIDLDVIAALLKDGTVTKTPIDSEGEVHKLCRDLAFEQIPSIVSRELYEERQYLNASIQRQDCSSGEFEQIAYALYDRMSKARASIPDKNRQSWTEEFIAEARRRQQKMEVVWDAKWRDNCDGKRFISDLHRAAKLKMPEAAFRERIVRTMRDLSSENWRLVKGMLEELLVTKIRPD